MSANDFVDTCMMGDVTVPKRNIWRDIDEDGAPWQWRAPWMARAIVVGRWAMLCFFGMMTLLCLGLTVVAFRDQTTPVTWGHFTETSTTCEGMGRNRHCTITGDWTSDDKTITLTDVGLDGGAEPGETVVAGYRADGWNSDRANNVVHTKTWISWGPWVGVVCTGTVAWFSASYWRKWNGGWRWANRLPPHQPRHAQVD